MNRTLLTLLACLLLPFSLAAEPAPNPTRVQLTTSLGEIVLELDEQAAPETCANFLRYVDAGFYDNTLFHRVIPGFMIQAGGFEPGMREKPTGEAVRNESANGLHNARGTVAMARTPHPDSAKSQFFINLVDNAYLDGAPGKPGYTVFAKVVAGMDVADRIAATQTTNKGIHRNVPAQDILVTRAARVAPAATTAPAPAAAPAPAPAAAPVPVPAPAPAKP